MTVGVAVVGHGQTASRLLEAAKAIVNTPSLDDVVAVDADSGETPSLKQAICQALDGIDHGQGVVVIVDLWGASPCQCARRHHTEHPVVVLSGLNLAMLLKLASLDRDAMDPVAVAQACANSAQRAVSVWSSPEPAAGVAG